MPPTSSRTAIGTSSTSIPVSGVLHASSRVTSGKAAVSVTRFFDCRITTGGAGPRGRPATHFAHAARNRRATRRGNAIMK